MGKLVYSAISSLDGYVADKNGNFDWGEPDEEVHTFINELGRAYGGYLYGRRLYEVMAAWEKLDFADEPPFMQDFARKWQAAEKIVYSTTLGSVSTGRTRIERNFDPEVVRRMKVSAEHDLTIGGPNLAAHAFRAGLIDECQLFLTPHIVGGGKQSLPSNVRLDLELVDEHRFGNGTVHLRYRARSR